MAKKERVKKVTPNNYDPDEDEVEVGGFVKNPPKKKTETEFEKEKRRK